MLRAEQGDILKVASIQYPLVGGSKNFFNESGMVMACPILRDAVCGPLRIRTSNAETPGYVYCEQLRIVDLNTRQFSRTGFIPLQELMDIMDAIQSIFDYV